PSASRGRGTGVPVAPALTFSSIRRGTKAARGRRAADTGDGMARVKAGGLAAIAALALAASATFLPQNAAAHPHVWIDAHSQVMFDDARRMAALRVVWRFDEFYSLFAIEGLDQDGNGTLTPAELQPLAELNVTSL